MHLLWSRKSCAMLWIDGFKYTNEQSRNIHWFKAVLLPTFALPLLRFAALPLLFSLRFNLKDEHSQICSLIGINLRYRRWIWDCGFWKSPRNDEHWISGVFLWKNLLWLGESILISSFSGYSNRHVVSSLKFDTIWHYHLGIQR